MDDELARSSKLLDALTRDRDLHKLKGAVDAGIITDAQAIAIVNLWHRPRT